MEIKFKTLTPIWTGGVGRNSDRIRESGILGSLRWWYEGIVRAMGGDACDPTQGKCSAKSDGKNEDTRLCPACQFFGATGWKRRFRLNMNGLIAQPLFFKASPNVYEQAGFWLWQIFGGNDYGGQSTGRGLNKKFSFTSQSLWTNDGFINVNPIGIDAEETTARFVFLLHIVTKYGGMGAKTQNGFGQIQIKTPFSSKVLEKGKTQIKKDVGEPKSNGIRSQNHLFNLKNFFSKEYELVEIDRYLKSLKEVGEKGTELFNNHYIPCAFDIRYKSHQKNYSDKTGYNFGMRPWFRERWGKGPAEILFGKTKAMENERVAGKIHVSHLYKDGSSASWKLKVWGCVPENIESEDGKKKGLKAVEQEVDDFIMGGNGMFPKSRVVSNFDFKEIKGK